MTFRIDMPTFAGGEIGDGVLARMDTAKYRTALRRARNVFVSPSGGAFNRPGLNFCGEVYDSGRKARVIPFQFSVNQGYAIELGHHTLQLSVGGGLVTRKELKVLSIAPAVGAPQFAAVLVDGPHGYVDGEHITFMNIEGMTEINGLSGLVLNHDATSFAVSIDVRGFSPFTGSGGGVTGDAAGGIGGDPPPPPAPAVGVPSPPPPPFYDTEVLPRLYFGDVHIF